jgi:transposase
MNSYTRAQKDRRAGRRIAPTNVGRFGRSRACQRRRVEVTDPTVWAHPQPPHSPGVPS